MSQRECECGNPIGVRGDMCDRCALDLEHPAVAYLRSIGPATVRDVAQALSLKPTAVRQAFCRRARIGVLARVDAEGTVGMPTVWRIA